MDASTVGVALGLAVQGAAAVPVVVAMPVGERYTMLGILAVFTGAMTKIGWDQVRATQGVREELIAIKTKLDGDRETMGRERDQAVRELKDAVGSAADRVIAEVGGKGRIRGA